MSKVYLAHAHEDNAFSHRLADDLQQAGVTLWYDRERMEIGEDMIQKMNEGLQDYDFFLVLWSRHSKESRWVEREIGVALSKQIHERRRLVPLLLDDTPLAPLLEPLRYVDFRSGYDEPLRELRRILVEGLAEGSKAAGVASTILARHAALAGMEERIQTRLEMFRLREVLWATVREAMLRWGGGFAGISLNPLSALAGLFRGQGPLEGAQGEARFQALTDFDELCQQAFNNQSVSGPPLQEACGGAQSVLTYLESWLADHPQRF